MWEKTKGYIIFGLLCAVSFIIIGLLVKDRISPSAPKVDENSFHEFVTETLMVFLILSILGGIVSVIGFFMELYDDGEVNVSKSQKVSFMNHQNNNQQLPPSNYSQSQRYNPKVQTKQRPKGTEHLPDPLGLRKYEED